MMNTDVVPQDDVSRLSRISSLFAIDLRSLAVFRICLGIILLVDLGWRSGALEFFYSDFGALPRADELRLVQQFTYSIYFLNGSIAYAAALFFLTAIFAAALVLGYRTKVASFLTWFLLLQLHRRNPQVLQGGDDFLRCLLFWGMFLPLGARWSLDSRSRREPPPQGGAALSLASAFLLLQVVLLYVFTAIMKSAAPWRVDGTAIELALKLDQLVKPFGSFLLQYPKLLRPMTFSVRALELLGPFVAFVPFYPVFFRGLMVCVFICFHFGLMLSMELGPFPYVCIAAWMLFLPGAFWDRVLPASRTPGAENPLLMPKTPLSAVRDGVLLFLFANVLCWNIRTTNFRRWEQWYPARYNFINRAFGLDQFWAMFSPQPLTNDGWYQISAQTRSGRTVNLTPGALPDDPLTDEKPTAVAAMYRDERFRKYLMNLASEDNRRWRPLYTAALARRWNREHPEDPIQSIDLMYWFEFSKIDAPDERRKGLLWHYDADAASAPVTGG